LNGDTYVDLNLSEMLGFHKNSGGLGTVGLVKMKNPTRYGVVNVSEGWRIIRFSQRHRAFESYINTGVYIFQNKILDYIPEGKKSSLEKEVLPHILDRERIFGFLTEGYFIDIGVPEDYYRFERDFDNHIMI
jgi:NDP-sugar pyrophosphorylase family protein